MQVHHCKPMELGREQVRQALRLIETKWPCGQGEERWIDHFYARHKAEPEYRLLAIWDCDGQLVAEAQIFARVIKTTAGPVTVLALAGVIVRPEQRGQGLGKQITQAALSYVDQGTYDLSIFQTELPDFYEKLGARRLSNRFVNSRDVENPELRPWKDPYVMVYPAAADVPKGTIDLDGPAW